jgi:hypothetical protein
LSPLQLSLIALGPQRQTTTSYSPNRKGCRLRSAGYPNSR